MSRKIFNYDSIILRDKTFEKFGYYPEKYGKSSAKFVVAICRFCGEEMDVRKGFFNKSGSACHKACKIEEMKLQKSPFSDPKVREKSQDTIKERYGEDRKEIRKKISEKKKSKETQEKYEKTCLEKYGVKNVFQSEEIKAKIRDTHLEKYGVEHHMKNKEILDKTKNTVKKRYGVDNVMQDLKIQIKSKDTIKKRYGVDNVMQNKDIQNKSFETNMERYGVKRPLQNEEILKNMSSTLLERYGVNWIFEDKEISDKINKSLVEKYGVENAFQSKEIREKIKNIIFEKYGVIYPSQYPEIKKKIMESFKKSVKENKNKKFNLVNTLRKQSFWDEMKNESMINLSNKYNINYSSLTSRVVSDEFKKIYYETYCFPKQQKQKEIFNILSKFYKEEDILFNDRKVISPLELDIYIPAKKFAIEFNGSFWHSEAWIKDSKEARNKHLNKTKLCTEKGIRLFHIFEHQWEEREKQILNFIKTILGVNQIKVPGRKCFITNDNANDFIDENHIQGNTNAVLKYFNLEYNGEIVASMTASKHHRQNTSSNDIVLSRLCFKDGINVQGGSSKLFKYFKKWAREQGFHRIVSWSDNCWTEGGIYNVLGFELETEYGPDYFYYDINNHTVHSKQGQKKRATNCPDGFTEREWAMERGLYRIYDCGKKKWVYNFTRSERESPRL